MRIRIEVSDHDVDGLANLRAFERRCFPGQHCIVHLEGVYVLELHHDRATFVRELLENEMNDPAFMHFGEWTERNEDQGELFGEDRVHVEGDRVAYS